MSLFVASNGILIHIFINYSNHYEITQNFHNWNRTVLLFAIANGQPKICIYVKQFMIELWAFRLIKYIFSKKVILYTHVFSIIRWQMKGIVHDIFHQIPFNLENLVGSMREIWRDILDIQYTWLCAMHVICLDTHSNSQIPNHMRNFDCLSLINFTIQSVVFSFYWNLSTCERCWFLFLDSLILLKANIKMENEKQNMEQIESEMCFKLLFIYALKVKFHFLNTLPLFGI